MVAIVTSANFGLQNSSATVLGGAGQIGDSRLGEAGTRVTVNAATGNLMVQNQDEMLFGRGIDAGISSHYNSLASYTSNDWQLNFSRMTNTLAGTVNTAGSTIRHYTGDGSYITYTWDATRSAYVGTESDGAYDTLTFDAGTNRWTWTDGATRAWDLYDGANSGRLMESTDASGNKLTYTYTSSRVSRITTANGEYLSLTYTGSLLSSIATYNASNVLIGTRTRYTYDTNTPSRLTTVTVDLTPEDNAISDGKTYVTTYDYVGTSTQISRITQSDGTLLDITYDGSNRVSTLVQTVSTVGGVSTTSTTSFTYNSNNTVVTDQQGNTTTLTYDSKKQLTRLVSQPATAGAPAQALAFTYDASGNLLYSGPSSDPLFSNYATSWNDLASSGSSITTAQSTEIDGGVSVYRRQTNGTMPAAGWNMRLGQGFTAYTPVSPGQNVQFSVYTASSGASALTLNAMWRRADNSLISTSSVALTPGGTLGASGIATANFGSLSATAPAEAVNVEFMVQGTAAGGQHMSVEIAQPLIAVGGSPQATAYAYTYDSKGNRTSMVDVYGVATTYSYDANNQLLTKTEAAGTSVAATTRYVYDTSSRLVYTVSPRGEVTRFVYNSYGQQTSILRYTGLLYLGQGALAEADLNTWAASAPVDKTQLQRTDMAYDARGQIQSVTNFADTDANGAGIVATASTTTYVYDPYGRMLNRQLSGSGATETFVYDGLGRTLSSTDYNGKQTTSVYTQSSTGLQTAVTFANGTVRTSVYNRAGELISVTDSGNGGLTATTSYVYDSVGNLIRTTDASGLKTHYVYDMLGRKVADVAPDGAITVYRYDGNSQLVATIQYANKVTSGQLSTLDGRTGSSAAVPLASVLPAEDTANDRWNWNVYDADGRLIEQIDAQGGVTAHTYDAAGRLIATTEYASKLAAATVTGFKTVAPVRLVLPTADAANDRVTRHFYNSDGQLIGTLDADGYLAQIIYDGGGRKVQTKAYNNATNAANRASGSFATLLADVGSHADDINNWWVYDGRGLLRAEIDGLGNVTTYDEYTPAGYVGRVREGRNISVSTLTALSYDAVNNVQNPITVSELHSNLPATTPQTTDYTYDRYGHVLTKTLILQGGATEVTTYVYDAAYNLMKESTASSTTADGDVDSRTHLIRWDSLGRKGAELTGEGANRIAGLGANPTPADIDAVWASNQISYVYDAAGRLIKTMDSDSRPVFYYYDINGRLAYEVNGTGDVTKYGYNVFGEKTTVTTYTSKISIASLSGGLITSTLTDRVAAIAASASTRTVNFNTLGQISSSVDALNKTTSFEYNAFGELQARVDPLSGATTVRTETLYTRRGLLKTSTADVGGLARVASYTYDAFGRQKTVTDAGNTTTSAYDRAGQLTSQTDALGKTTSFVYDALGRVVQITDRNNKQTSYAFSLFDRQVTVTDANGVVTTTTSNAYGQTVRIAITGGETTTYEYDLDGNLTRTIDGAGTVTHAYSSARVLTRTTDARGIETTYDYDAASRVFRQRVDPTGLNLVTERSYDGKGQVLTVTDANTVVTRYEYDLEGRKLKEIVDNGGLNVTTQWAYDDAGRVVSMTSPAGVVVSYAYDKLSRLTSETLNPGGLNLVTSYEYDAAGNVIKKTDAAGGITRNVYDGNNRLAFTIDPENRVSQYTYDDEGRLIQTKTYNTLYDVAGNRTLAQMTAWIGGKTYLLTRSAYDAGGRLAFSVDAAGAVTAYSYDANDNVTQSVQYAVLYPTGNSGTLSDLASWIVGKTTDARTTTFVYDAAGRVTSKTVDPGTSPKLNLVTSYTYDANGNVLSETDPANRVTRYTYDAADRVNFIINPDNSVRAVSYDKVGRVIATYAYAALHSVSGDRTFAQMKSWADANPTGARVTRTTYDAAGRELYAINAENYVTGYTYNADGQVTQKVEYAAVYTPVNWNVSDANGWASANTANARTTTYAYDGAGRLQQVTDPMGIATRYAYDGMGRTTSVKVAYGTADEAETTYLYWADGQLRREITAAGSGVAEATTWRIYDEQGRVKETRDGFGNGTSYAYSYNSTGLVVTTTNMTNGAVTVSEKNAFGEQIKVTDARGYSGYFYYDAAGRQIAQRDTEDYWTQTVYNNAGEVDYVKRFANKIVNNTITPDADRDNKTSFTYDNAGRVKTSIDGNGKTTSYDYNAFGDRVSMTNAMGAVVTYAYDKRGLMTSQTTPAGVAMDGSTAIATAPAVTTAYTYNAFGNRTQMVEAQGIAGVARTTNYAYDKNNQLITQTGDAVTTTNINGFTWTVTPTQSFSYDLRGNQVTATDANGAVTTSYYDKQNRKTAQVDAVGALTVWAYDDNGNVINQKAYAGTHATGNPAAQPAASGSVRETTYAYDSANRLTATNVLGVPMGSWSLVANGWNSQTATVTTTTTYDLNGNAISQTNGNNNTSYTWYDKLSRKIAAVDAEGYMTKYELDHEGNVVKQTQYVTKLTGTLTAGGTPPAAPGAHADDRITEYQYDHNGQRVKETRKLADYSTVSGNSIVNTTDQDVSATFVYNNLGQVIQKTEATGEVTTFLYDNLGRVAIATTASGLRTLSTYDGLGNLLTTTAGYGTAGAQTTTYTYGPGGRLKDKTDAEGFKITYGYDANGQKTIEWYDRKLSNNTTIREAKQFGYDAIGQLILEGAGSWTGSQYVSVQATDSWYNAYGELMARGTNTNRDLAKAQEYADYDAAGRAWRTNMGDGVAKVYFYDANGNTTLQIQSRYAGTTDLRDIASHGDSLAATDVTRIYSVYNKRNELIDVRRPVSVNLDGTVASGGNVVVDT
ncbi:MULTISPECIES: RHS repeat protein, partial [Asticcacaulis]|uniref:RHS repeat protein n=1 Tax=Asticcacaulis TaxID=76890 RepID=UPI001AE8DAF3